MAFRKHKCAWCGEYVEREEDNISDTMGTKTLKHFHKWCVENAKKSKEEKGKFDEVYEYIKGLMGYSKTQQLTPHMRNKIMSIRKGDFVKRDDKMYNSNGYSYEVILTTFKATSIKIKQAIYGKVFEDDNHKFNYIMAIMMNSINDIQKRIDNKKKVDELASKQSTEVKTSIQSSLDKYKEGKTKDKKENKVADDLADLF